MHQPVIKYKAIDIFLNFFISIEFNTMPIIAKDQTIPKIVHPKEGGNFNKTIGVYVPAIKIKIEQWSIILNTLFPLFLFKE